MFVEATQMPTFDSGDNLIIGVPEESELPAKWCWQVAWIQEEHNSANPMTGKLASRVNSHGTLTMWTTQSNYRRPLVNILWVQSAINNRKLQRKCFWYLHTIAKQLF